MLRHIDPILSPELLAILRQMGHGDEIAIVDANFPAATMGKRVVRADGVTATHMAEAILNLMPLDAFESETAFVMRQVHARMSRRRSAWSSRDWSNTTARESSRRRCWSGLPSMTACGPALPW